jgi:pantoate kinase
MAKLLVLSALVCLSHGSPAGIIAPTYYAQVPYGYAVAAPAAVAAAPAITDPEAAASAAQGLQAGTDLLDKLVEKLKNPEALKIPTGYAAQVPLGYGYATAAVPAAPAITDPEAAASAAQGLQAATALLDKLVEKLKNPEELKALLGYSQVPVGYGYASAAAPAITDPEAAASAAQGLQAATALLDKLVEELKKRGADLIASPPSAVGIPTLPAPVFGAPITVPAIQTVA